jgi:hypothetical protein
MPAMRFRDLPIRAKVAVALILASSWVLFEETVVDRHGLWRYMPHYKVGLPCVWDLAVGTAILAGLLLWSVGWRRRREP